MEFPSSLNQEAGSSSDDSNSSSKDISSPCNDQEQTSRYGQIDDSPLVNESSPSSSLAMPSVVCIDEQEIPSTSSPASSNGLIGQQIILVESIDGEVMVEVPVDSKEMISTSTNTDSPPESPLNDYKNKSSIRKFSQKSRRATPYSRRKKASYVESSSSSDEQDDYIVVGGRRERKRDQNRTAASRYRAKKRSEQEVLSMEEGQLLSKNKELSQTADRLSTEIGYLKGLMREMLVAKGLLKT